MRRWGFGHRGKSFLETKRPGNGLICLTEAVRGKKYRIVSINGGCRLNSHLCAMGFIPYEIFHVSGASRGGSLCVIIKARKILVREMEG